MGSPRSSREERDVFTNTCFRTSEVDHILKGGGGDGGEMFKSPQSWRQKKKTFILNHGAFIQ